MDAKLDLVVIDLCFQDNTCYRSSQKCEVFQRKTKKVDVDFLTYAREISDKYT